MTTPITRFVLEMATSEREVSREVFTEMWSALRAMLTAEMKRRSSWTSPPSYLGVLGHSHWAQPGEDTDALEELAAEAFQEVFLRRLGSLQAQAREKPSVDGVVLLTIRHFLLELQRLNDPLGFRVYEVLRRVMLREIENGRLFVVGGSQRIRNGTRLARAPSCTREEADAVDAEPLAQRWAGQHLEAFVTATHRSLSEFVKTLGDDLASWLAAGPDGFRFGSLVAPLKATVRAAWANRYLGSETRALSADRDSGDTTRQALERFRALAECVHRSLEGAEHTKKTQAHLARLWSFLEAFAADGWKLDPADLETREVLPSHREISRLLGIPRERIPELLRILGEYLKQCGLEVDSLNKGGPMATPPPTQTPKEKALAMARAAQARSPSSRDLGAPFRIGDILRLPEAPVPGVFWLLLTALPKGGYRAVAVDSCPFVGPADLPLPERELQEPWVLRRDFELDLPQHRISKAILVDQLAPDLLEAALTDPDLGSHHPVEADLPAYREWIEQGPQRAYEKLKATPLPFEKKRTPIASNPFAWLAAVLALVAVGLGIQVGRLGTVVEELSAPVWDPPYREVHFSPNPRGSWTLEIPTGASAVQIGLILDDPDQYPAYRIDLVSRKGQILYQTGKLEAEPEYSITVRKRILPPEGFSFRLYGITEERSELINEQKVEVVERSQGP